MTNMPRKSPTQAVPTFVGVDCPNFHPSCNYLGNALHPNHEFVEVEPPRPIGSATIESLVRPVERMLDLLNHGRDPKHKYRIAFDWVVVSLAPGSWLTPKESADGEDYIARAGGFEHPHVRCIHRGLGGATDYNYLVPCVYEYAGMIRLFRSRRVYSLGRLRHACDRWIKQANAARAEEGRPPIPPPLDTPAARCKAQALAALIERVAQGCLKMGMHDARLPDLGRMMHAAGIARDAWDVDLRGRLLVHPGASEAPKRPKKETPVVFPVHDFLRAVRERALALLARVFGRGKKSNVPPPQGTASDVVHRDAGNEMSQP